MDEQTRVQLESLVTSLVLPFVISLIKNPKWSPEMKQWFSILFSLIVSGLLLYLENKLDFTNILFSALLIVAATQGNYHVWFKKTDIEPFLANSLVAPKDQTDKNNDATEDMETEKETESGFKN
jgi:hypothetical protein